MYFSYIIYFKQTHVYIVVIRYIRRAENTISDPAKKKEFQGVGTS